ncbi:MAG: hypothetical protein JRH18_18780 [Deltaproteobacteria bacterium]|nr:hypothetical protein [Deltaproteobacteria bacterium]MBW2153700.1 hypothetical protein [Deltaproteobacteria bacterium]
MTVQEQFFDGLYVLDEKTLRPKPNLAISHKLVKDTTWEFVLRRGVKFSNGEPFDANVVKYTLERVLDPKRKLYDRPTWDKILDRVEIVDDYTVRLITKKPYPIMLEKLAFDAYMVPPKYIEKKGDSSFGEHPIGTGPYKLIQWKRGEEILFETNDLYWGEKPAIPKLHFRIIPESAVATAELITGGVDIVGRLDADQVPTVEKSKKAKVYQSPSNRIHFLQLDGDGRGGPTPFQNLKARLAVYHAIDRETIIKEIKRGYGTMLHGPLYRKYFGYDPGIKDIEPKYDPEKAKQLLTEAGYKGGFEAELSGYMQKQVLEAIQGYLRRVGIKTKLNWYGADLGTLIKLRNAGKVKDVAMYTWGTNIYDPDYILPYWFGYNAEKNYNRDKQIDEWLTAAAQTFDKDKRKELYSKVQRRIVEQAYWVPVFAEVSLYGINKGLDFVSLGEFPRYYRCSWKK